MLLVHIAHVLRVFPSYVSTRDALPCGGAFDGQGLRLDAKERLLDQELEARDRSYTIS